MGRKKIFISFDYTNDHRYKDLLLAWNANKDFDISFNDFTSQEIQSNDISIIKASLTRKINEADYTLVIIGKECCKTHKDHSLIGCNNWQEFEIKQSIEAGNKLIAVKLSLYYTSPSCLFSRNVRWAMSFTYDAIKKAINYAQQMFALCYGNNNKTPECLKEQRGSLNGADKVQIYYDHYKDTFVQIKEYIKKRDRLTLILILLLSLICFLMYEPMRSLTLMQQAAEARLGVKDLGLEFLKIVSFAALAYVSLSYYQICLLIEKFYTYLHNVEFNLSGMTGLNIEREGVNYLKRIPLLTNTAHVLFAYGIPLLVVAISSKTGYDCFVNITTFYGWIELILLFISFLFSILYVVDRVRM